MTNAGGGIFTPVTADNCWQLQGPSFHGTRSAPNR